MRKWFGFLWPLGRVLKGKKFVRLGKKIYL